MRRRLDQHHLLDRHRGQHQLVERAVLPVGLEQPIEAEERREQRRDPEDAAGDAGERLRHREQAQRVAGGRGVEHYMVEHVADGAALAGQQRCKFVERRDLGGAGARELFAHGLAFVVAGAGFELREHALAVGLGGCVGVDVEHLQPWHTGHGHRPVGQRHAEHFVEVGCGVGADEQHALACVGQRDGGGGGERGFADTALAGEEQETGGRGGEAGQRGGVHARSIAHPRPADHDVQQARGSCGAGHGRATVTDLRALSAARPLQLAGFAGERMKGDSTHICQ